jgi:hypothetical protein
MWLERQGLSLAKISYQLLVAGAAWVSDLFRNFYLAENHKFANNTT